MTQSELMMRLLAKSVELEEAAEDLAQGDLEDSFHYFCDKMMELGLSTTMLDDLTVVVWVSDRVRPWCCIVQVGSEPTASEIRNSGGCAMHSFHGSHHIMLMEKGYVNVVEGTCKGVGLWGKS